MPRFTFAQQPVQLSYSTNVHPARRLADIRAFLATDTTRVRALVAGDRPFGVCLHLAEATIGELAPAEERSRFAAFLGAHELEVVAINGFPLGDFHAPVVKERAYQPDWTSTRRRDLTKSLADIFASLLPEGGSGTISTLAGSYKPWGDDFTIHERIALHLVMVVAHLDLLEQRTGRHILLGLEPEPFTTLETLPEVLTFFRRHVEPAAKNAGLAERWRRYLGLNVDLCHQAVEFEDLPATLDRLHDAGIPIGSVHAAAALRIPLAESGALDRLAAFDEPRYLHQVVGADREGVVRLRAKDLPELLARPRSELEGLAELRCHFHVPLGPRAIGGQLGPLHGFETTADLTAAAVRHLLAKGYAHSVVAETYTWGVGPLPPDSLPERLAAELNWLIDAVGLERN